jgi:hypothetical protein
MIQEIHDPEIVKSVLARQPKRSWCKDGLGAGPVLVQGLGATSR